MTILDVNILLYAYDPGALQHPAIISWLQELLDSQDTIGLPWTTIWGFLRIGTNQRIRLNPRTAPEAFQKIKSLLGQPRIVIVEPGPRHIEILERVIHEGQATGPLVSDAALAALAIENGALLASTDRDFSRFPNLRWVNPLSQTA